MRRITAFHGQLDGYGHIFYSNSAKPENRASDLCAVMRRYKTTRHYLVVQMIYSLILSIYIYFIIFVIFLNHKNCNLL